MDDWQEGDRWSEADRAYMEISPMVHLDRQQEDTTTDAALREVADQLDADVRCGRRTPDEAQKLYDEYETTVYGSQSTESHKRNKRNAHRERLVRMTLTFNRAELDTMMPPIIREANIHSRHVAGEEKHKAERHERVGFFVTDLRRFIGYKTGLNTAVLRSLVLCLCNKAVWYDAGVLEATFNFPTSGTSGIEPHDLRRWVQAAEMIVDQDEFAVVDRLLAEVKEGNDEIRLLLQRADTVGGRADRAADDLVDFLAQTAAS